MDTLSGGADADALLGEAGNDLLYGDGGADTMQGGGGDDSYWVDSAGDTIFENAGEGTWDVVWSSVDYTLSSDVEVIALTGNATRATGHAGHNVLYATYTASATTLAGGGGDDYYVVDSTSDVIVENAGEGSGDAVYSTVDYVLGPKPTRFTATASRILLTAASVTTGSQGALAATSSCFVSATAATTSTTSSRERGLGTSSSCAAG